MGRRTAAAGDSAPAGDARPIFFLRHQKENAPRPVEKKTCSAGRPAQAQPSCRRRGKVGSPLRQSETETRRPWGNLQPGEVQGYPLPLSPLPLTLPCGRASGSENRRRVYPFTSPGWRFPQGPGVSVPDCRKGPSTIPRRRQEVCACADRPAEHVFFSTGRGAFSF